MFVKCDQSDQRKTAQKMESDAADYITVRFERNSSKKWDGKEVEVPGKTVVGQGRYTAEGLEEAEVHWPGKGKSKGKIWRCVVLKRGEMTESESEEEETNTPLVKRLALEGITGDKTATSSSSAVAQLVAQGHVGNTSWKNSWSS